MTTPLAQQMFRLRSFVRRDGRITDAQTRARAELGPRFELQVETGLLHYPSVFGREAERYLEIGFGSGHSLLALAEAARDKDFIGVETHKPGVGALFLGMQQQALTNLRVYSADVVDVIEKCIPHASLDGVQIFFPDPWQKRRHHPRRLIQPAFIKQIGERLKPGAALHMATDWKDYALHMMRVMSQQTEWVNLAGEHQFATRSPYRPILTKFERRAEREGRPVFELQFKKL